MSWKGWSTKCVDTARESMMGINVNKLNGSMNRGVLKCRIIEKWKDSGDSNSM